MYMPNNFMYMYKICLLFARKLSNMIEYSLPSDFAKSFKQICIN